MTCNLITIWLPATCHLNIIHTDIMQWSNNWNAWHCKGIMPAPPHHIIVFSKRIEFPLQFHNDSVTLCNEMGCRWFSRQQNCSWGHHLDSFVITAFFHHQKTCSQLRCEVLQWDANMPNLPKFLAALVNTSSEIRMTLFQNSQTLGAWSSRTTTE